MGITRRAIEAAYEALRINPDALNVAPESAPRVTAGSGAPSASDPRGSVYHRTDGASGTTIYQRISGAWDALIGTSTLASTANGAGASLVGIEDAGGYTAATDAEAALAELYANTITCTLTAGTEATDTIAITLNAVSITGAAVSRTQRYIVSAYEATMIEATALAITLAETGAGSEISTTANARLIIETDASGDAVVTATDVAGGSGKTFYIVAEPVPPSGTNEYGLPAMVAITFD